MVGNQRFPPYNEVGNVFEDRQKPYLISILHLLENRAFVKIYKRFKRQNKRPCAKALLLY